MASSPSTKQSSSRFSTFKVFRFTGSKPPRPPPKDPNYLYPASNNPSLVSLSNQSLYSQPPLPASTSTAPSQFSRNKTNGNGALSIRSPSPTPSRILQSSSQCQQQQPPPLPSMSSSSTLAPDSGSSNGKRGFFRKMSTIGKRSASKPSRADTVDDVSDVESISRPYNVQVSPLLSALLPDLDLISSSFFFSAAPAQCPLKHAHPYDNIAPYSHRRIVRCHSLVFSLVFGALNGFFPVALLFRSFQGIPPAWSSTLAELGYSEAEIALILKGRRNRVPDLTSVQDYPVSTSTPLSRSSTTISVNRSASLRRQRSDGSIARSERSLRNGPPVPPPPLPLPPPPPQTVQAPPREIVPTAAPPPTPASTGGASVEAGDVDVASQSEAQYVYVNLHRQTPNGPVAVLPPGKVPVIQPAPVRQQRSNSNMPAQNPPSPVGSVNSNRERRSKAQPAPRRQFRVVNATSPPPVYSDDLVPSGLPPPITLEDALQPRPQEKDSLPLSQHSTAPIPAPRDRIKTPPQDSPPAKRTLHDGTEAKQEEQNHGLVRNGSERFRPRPDLSILPPRVSLRKDTLEDLSSWSASLFSSLPSALHDSPASSTSTAPTSASTSQVSQPETTRHRAKPSVTLPTIVLHPELREEDEDELEDGEGDGEDGIRRDSSQSTTPLYQELMGMMQGHASVSNAVSSPGLGSPGPGSPGSADFQLDAASSSSHGASSRDSQLTIRFNPRDSTRDSSASISTLTHATIVRGASIARRVRADVVTTPRAMAVLKGKERAREQASVQVVQEDDDVDEDEGDSSSDATSSEYATPGSPVGTLAFTSGPNSQEDAGNKSPRQMHRYSSPLPSPSPSPLRASFPESASEELRQEQEQDERGEETEKALPQVPYVTPPPSAPPVTVRRPPITIATDLENVIGIPVSLSTPMIQVEDIENGPVLASTPSYPSWLAAIVLPLAEFIDDRADPRALFTDLQEIGQGESGSVYSACAAPTVAPQFRPPTPCSPVSEISLPEGDEADEGRAQPKQGLVAIKCVPLLRGGTEKLADLRRELELTRALRHPNLLYMERLYVDVAEESLWIGMELMDRSLADVLAVVGEETGSAQVALETQEDGGDGDSGSGPGGAGVVEISEKMIARFMWDVRCLFSSNCLFLVLLTGGFVGPPGIVVYPQTPYCASGCTLGQLASEQIWGT